MPQEIGQCSLCRCIIYADDHYQRAGDAADYEKWRRVAGRTPALDTAQLYLVSDTELMRLGLILSELEGFVEKCHWKKCQTPKPKTPSYLDVALNEGSGVYVP